MKPARHSQLAAAVCPVKLIPEMEVASLSDSGKTTAPQLTSKMRACNAHTPELKSSMVTTAAVRQVRSNNSSYHATSSSYKQSKYHTKQATQANHDDDSQNADDQRLKPQRTAAAAAAVMARAPSPQANERRMAKETQAETATYREQGRGEIKKLAF